MAQNLLEQRRESAANGDRDAAEWVGKLRTLADRLDVALD
jgi:hypothetical protein